MALTLCLEVPQKEKKQKHGNFDEGDRDQGESQSEVKKKWVDYRLRCINCCEKCKQGKCYPIRKHGGNMERQRLGRKSVHYCPTCGVVLCNFCWQKFHSNDIELPPCSPFSHMLRTTTRCTTELEQRSERTFILRRQVSPREEESDDEEEKSEVEETASEEEIGGHRTARSGKTYSPRKKGLKQKRGALENEDEESEQSDRVETPMQQVLRVAQSRGSSPNRDNSLFSSPDNSPSRGSKKRQEKQSPMRRLRSAVGRSAVGRSAVGSAVGSAVTRRLTRSRAGK